MEVNDPDVAGIFLNEALHRLERVIGNVIHVYAAVDVEYAYLPAFKLNDPYRLAIFYRAHVCRPDHPVGVLYEREDVVLGKSVIAHGHAVSPGIDETVVDLAGDPLAMGTVFPVYN